MGAVVAFGGFAFFGVGCGGGGGVGVRGGGRQGKGLGIGGQEVVGRVDGPEAEEHGDGEERVGRFAEGGELEERACGAGGQARAGEEEAEGLEG